MKKFQVTGKVEGNGLVNYQYDENNIITMIIKCKNEINAVKGFKTRCRLTSCNVLEIINIKECI